MQLCTNKYTLAISYYTRASTNKFEQITKFYRYPQHWK